MSTSIDQLTIEVSASAEKANRELDKLVKRLDAVSSSIMGINTAKLNDFTSSLNGFATAVNSINSIKVKEFGNVAKIFNKFDSVNTSKIAATAKAVEDFSTKLTGIAIPDLSGITKFANAMKNLGKVDLIKASADFPKFARSLTDFVKDINAVAPRADISAFSGLFNNIKNLGGKAATVAVANIPKLTRVIRDLLDELSKAPRINKNVIDLIGNIAKLARTGTTGGRTVKSLSESLSHFSKNSKIAKVSAMSLAGAMGILYSIYEGFQKALGSINLASSLTEAQNVLDVTFGKYSNLIENLSKTSVIDFGMSELTAKKTASQFQAMGVALGFTQEKMAEMSTALTKLTADMSSFYNVSQEDMSKSLQAIFTGETEPLRKFGLDLSQATVQEWALKQGIDANMRSISQMEKAILRYQYVMSNTGAAQGDFLRTQDSWANQTRILKQNLEQLAIVLGQTLINSLKPLVQALNSGMQAVISFATTVSNALGAIFGWTYESGSGGITSDMLGAEDASGGLADNMGNAAASAKKLNSYTSKLDELNILQAQDDSSGSAGGSIGSLSGNYGEDNGAWKKTDGIFKAYESQFNSLFSLGEHIGNTLTNQLANINWDSVYEKARGFGSGLAQFLNGLISPELFYEVGSSVAGALNTSLHFLNSFGETFEWKEFGTSLASGLKGFFENWDAGLTAATLSTFANGILITAKAAIDELGKNDTFEDIGQKLVDFICGIDWGGLTWNLIGLFQSFANAVAEFPYDLSRGIAEGIIKHLTGKEIEIEVPEEVENGIKYLFVGAMPHVALLSFLPSQEEFNEWFTNDVQPAFSKEKWEGLGTNVKDSFGNMVQGIKDFFVGIADWIGTNVTTPISNLFTELWGKIKGVWETASSWFYTTFIEPITLFFEGFALRIWQIFEGISLLFQATWILLKDFIVVNFIEPVVEIFSSLWLWLTESLLVVPEWFTENVTTPTANKFTEFIELVAQKFEELWTGIKETWSKVSEFFNKTVITPVKTAFSLACDSISGFFDKLWKGVKTGVCSAMNSVIGSVESALNSVINAINGVLSGFNSAVQWAAEIVGESWSGVTLIPSIQLPRIPAYATGGFPEDGLFFANHNELVGQFSNGRTAVANNEQIIAGIKQGVKEAVSEALSPYLADIAQNTRETADKEFSLGIDDGRELVKVIDSTRARMGYRLIT